MAYRLRFLIVSDGFVGYVFFHWDCLCFLLYEFFILLMKLHFDSAGKFFYIKLQLVVLLFLGTFWKYLCFHVCFNGKKVIFHYILFNMLFYLCVIFASFSLLSSASFRSPFLYQVCSHVTLATKLKHYSISRYIFWFSYLWRYWQFRIRMQYRYC